jgi:putative Mg2+ transporter-C (MgtC) family protein
MADWLEQINHWLPFDTVARLVVAAFAGALIGWEREWADKPAGLRTHMLVSLGAAAFLVGGIEFLAQVGEESQALRLDPMRILAAIIGGVGFLGAGTIIQSRGSVKGITTAASIWVCAALGTCAGMGLYRLTLICGLLTILVLWGIGLLEHYVFRTKTAADP